MNLPENLSFLDFFLEYLEKSWKKSFFEFLLSFFNVVNGNHSFIYLSLLSFSKVPENQTNEYCSCYFTLFSNIRNFDSLSSKGKFFGKKAGNLRSKICRKIEFLRIFAWVLVFLALSFSFFGLEFCSKCPKNKPGLMTH